MVNNFHPTGTTEEDNFSISISIHPGQSSHMHFDYERMEPISWVNYLAFLLKSEPKRFSASYIGRRSCELLINRFLPVLYSHQMLQYSGIQLTSSEKNGTRSVELSPATEDIVEASPTQDPYRDISIPGGIIAADAVI